MVKLFILILTSLAVFAQCSSFCGTKITPAFRSLAAKFATQDALDFPGHLNAAGTDLNIPTKARSGSLLPALIKKLNWSVPNKKWINVKTYVHVVAASKKYEDGWVSEKAVLDQLISLNLDYGMWLPQQCNILTSFLITSLHCWRELYEDFC
jgi:hypothetical protein